MDEISLFKNIHEAIDIFRWKKMKDHPEIVSKETFDQAVNYLNVDPDDIYYDPHHFLNPCIYHKGFVHVNLYDMNIGTLKALRVRMIIEQQTKHFEEILKNNDYEQLFSVLDKPFLIPTFIEIYQKIPKELVYDIFIHLYTRSEYGFEKLPADILLDLKNDKSQYSKERIERMEALKKKLKKETIVVYRGMGSLSVGVHSALSWTLSRKTAQWFAKRFRAGRISRKIIKFDDVLDYLDDRSEQEILILPS